MQLCPAQTTRIYHPNVTDDGAICMGLLKSEAWKPSTKIEQSELDSAEGFRVNSG